MNFITFVTQFFSDGLHAYRHVVSGTLVIHGFGICFGVKALCLLYFSILFSSTNVGACGLLE